MSDFIGNYVEDSSRPGIAIYVTGWEKKWKYFTFEDVNGDIVEDLYEGEWVDDVDGLLVGHYVGDDMELLCDPENLTLLDDQDNICSCGQLGCSWG